MDFQVMVAALVRDASGYYSDDFEAEGDDVDAYSEDHDAS